MAVVSRNSLVPRGGHCYRVTREPSRGLKQDPPQQKTEPRRPASLNWWRAVTKTTEFFVAVMVAA